VSAEPGPLVQARHQPPVKRQPPRPPRLSQTMLALGDKCMHAAYLSLIYDGGALSHPMGRGSLYHAFQERAMWTLIELGQPNLYAGVEGELIAEFEAQHNRHPNVRELDAITAAARSGVADHTAAIVDEILRENPRLIVPQADVDDVREMAYHWAIGYDVAPDRVIGLETKILLPLPSGRIVSMKVDVLYAGDSPDVQGIDDAKTSFDLPSREDIERDFQLKLYAAGVAFGYPVEKEPCGDCGGRVEHDEMGQSCETCEGRGYAEVRGESLSDGVNYWQLRQVLPRYLDDDGYVRTRPGRHDKPVIVSRTDLHDFVADVETKVAAFDYAFDTGHWDAVPGDHCDSYCPAKKRCPLPPVLRDQLGLIDTREEAQAALELVEVYDAQKRALLKAVRNWAKTGGPVEVGRDVIYEWRDDEKRETDYDGLDAGVHQAVEYGGVEVDGQIVPFDLRRYRKKRVSTSFKRRKLTKAEIAERRSTEGGH
jgi:hypothetical protein